MSKILWFATVVIAALALVFLEAERQISIGVAWASEACDAAKIFCQHPEYLGYSAGVTLVLTIAVMIGEATT